MKDISTFHLLAEVKASISVYGLWGSELRIVEEVKNLHYMSYTQNIGFICFRNVGLTSCSTI
jgi:hypothetical protein